MMHMLKGYPVGEGFRGFLNGTYKLYATENEYVEDWRERNESVCRRIEQGQVSGICVESKS